MRVLVIEDEPVLCELIYEEITIEFGSRLLINTFMSSTQALLYARETEFDLVITDCMMPDLSGERLIAALKELPTLRSAAYVMISGSPEVASKKLAALNIDAAILEKPIPYDRLFVLVRNLLERKRASRFTVK